MFTFSLLKKLILAYLQLGYYCFMQCFMEPLKKVQVEGFLMFAEPRDLFGNLDELCYVSPPRIIRLLWSPYGIGQTIIFSSCSLFFFFSSPNLSRRRLDVYHTSTHGVALVRIYNAGLKCAACGSLKIQDAKNRQKFAIWAPSDNFVGLYLRNEGTYRQSEKTAISLPDVLTV